MKEYQPAGVVLQHEPNSHRNNYNKYNQICHPPNLGGFFPQRPMRLKAPPNPIMHAKPIHYKPDGAGRDRYIE